MKKFIICLLLICTICLGCFALTACDEKTTKKDATIEFVSNIYTPLLSTGDSLAIYNRYFFRFLYPLDWFKKGIEPQIQYKLTNEEDYKNFPDYGIHAVKNGSYYAPDHYIYLRLEFNTEPKEVYIRIIAKYVNQQIDYDNILISSHFNLQGTFKTA